MFSSIRVLLRLYCGPSNRVANGRTRQYLQVRVPAAIPFFSQAGSRGFNDVYAR